MAVLKAAARRASATVVVKGKPKFPIPDKAHARAAQAYDQAAFELYGEYAATNGMVVQPPLQSIIRKPGQIQSKNESGFRGVWKDNSTSWVAKIGVKGKNIRLGTFADKTDAARAYDRAVIAIKGKRALTNFPLEDYDVEGDE
jgi:hypothetical protein